MLEHDSGVCVAEPEPMARKKTEPMPAEEPKRGQDILLVYKADKATAPAFKEWLEGLARHVKAPLTVTVDMALNEFAQARGFKKPMPDRLVR